MKIIDVHTHPVFFNDDIKREDIDRTIKYGKKFGYKRMVVLGDVLRYGKAPTAKQISILNDETAQLLEWYPDFFIGFCYLNPVLGAKAVHKEVDRCAKRGFKGIKLEICNNAADPVMEPVMEAAEEHGLVVLQHTADMTVLKARKFHSDPADTALLGRRHPNVRIIMAHLTTCELRGTLEIKDVPNVWVDTSAYLPFSGRVEYAVRHLGAERILYGSDLLIRDVPSQVGRILGADITEAEKERILYTNAANLLGVA